MTYTLDVPENKSKFILRECFNIPFFPIDDQTVIDIRWKQKQDALQQIMSFTF